MLTQLKQLLAPGREVKASVKAGGDEATATKDLEPSSVGALEHRRIHRALEALKERGSMSIDAWCDLVEEAIRLTCPPDSVIPQRVKALRTQPSQSNPVETGGAGAECTRRAIPRIH